MRTKYTETEFREAIKSSLSIAETCRKLGLKGVGGNYGTIHRKIKEYCCDTSHFTGQGWNKGLFIPKPAKPLKEILTKDSSYKSCHLHKRLIKESVRILQCECCKLTQWQGHEIPLELHHVNGIKSDNRDENLQLLCPNCHALTNNFRNNKR